MQTTSEIPSNETFTNNFERVREKIMKSPTKVRGFTTPSHKSTYLISLLASLADARSTLKAKDISDPRIDESLSLFETAILKLIFELSSNEIKS